MTLLEIKRLLHGRILTKTSNLDITLTSAFSSDMMSHVLAYGNDKSILITALYNPQALRTADLMGITCVIFIGRNDPDQSLIDLANSLCITIMRTDYSMYITCGLLFSNGLKGNYKDVQQQ